LTHLAIATSFFPYDPAIDSVMGHRHLIMAYCLVWSVQLCYLLFVLRKWYSANKPEAEAAEYERTQEL
jgi:hypothetical protein